MTIVNNGFRPSHYVYNSWPHANQPCNNGLRWKQKTAEQQCIRPGTKSGTSVLAGRSWSQYDLSCSSSRSTRASCCVATLSRPTAAAAITMLCSAADARARVARSWSPTYSVRSSMSCMRWTSSGKQPAVNTTTTNIISRNQCAITPTACSTAHRSNRPDRWDDPMLDRSTVGQLSSSVEQNGSDCRQPFCSTG